MPRTCVNSSGCTSSREGLPMSSWGSKPGKTLENYRYVHGRQTHRASPARTPSSRPILPVYIFNTVFSRTTVCALTSSVKSTMPTEKNCQCIKGAIKNGRRTEGHAGGVVHGVLTRRKARAWTYERSCTRWRIRIGKRWSRDGKRVSGER